MPSFGENIQNLMKERQMNVPALAKAINVSAKTVQEWVGKNARVPRNPEHLRKLAEFFGRSVHFLLFSEEDPNTIVARLLEKTEIHTGLYEITVKRVKPPR